MCALSVTFLQLLLVSVNPQNKVRFFTSKGFVSRLTGNVLLFTDYKIKGVAHG
jgi:hypothetical protein